LYNVLPPTKPDTVRYNKISTAKSRAPIRHTINDPTACTSVAVVGDPEINVVTFECETLCNTKTVSSL